MYEGISFGECFAVVIPVQDGRIRGRTAAHHDRVEAVDNGLGALGDSSRSILGISKYIILTYEIL